MPLPSRGPLRLPPAKARPEGQRYGANGIPIVTKLWPDLTKRNVRIRACYRGSMFLRIALASVLAAVPLFAQAQQGQEEKPRKVPKDSVLVVITGCVKGRVIRAADVRQTDTTSGVNIRAKTFRLEGKKDVIKAIKEIDGERAEVTGLIKKSALIEPGISVMGGRVRIGAGTSGGTSSSLPDPAENVVVLDVENVQPLGGSCAMSPSSF